MKLRLFAVNRENLVEELPLEPPRASWLTDGRLRWLDIEEAPDPLLAKLLAPIGIDSQLLDRYRHDTHTSGFVERPHVIIFSHPALSMADAPTSSLHVACLSNLLVTFRSRPAILDFDGWLSRWIEGWPLASPSIAALVHRLMESLSELERESFESLRREIAGLGREIRAAGAKFDADRIDDRLNVVHRVSTFFFDQHLIFTALQTSHTPAFSVGTEAERFRLSAIAADDISQGAGKLQARLENLQQQYMLEVQGVTDRNIRILTVFSAIFLPLTLIAGVYGMNFENMPELDDYMAYPLTLAFMGLIAVGMLVFFWVRGWMK